MTDALVCVMAKAPVAGAAKTRLSPPLTPEVAARLAGAFLLDTWRIAASVPGVAPVLCYAGERGRFPAALGGVEAWPQVEGDLGARMEHAARRGLQRAQRVVLIGSDAPALPAALLRGAIAALADAEAVVGPALDGGYYLLGLRQCPPGLLAELPWSAPDTLEATCRRLAARGWRVARLPTWFDVDDAAGLALLRRALAIAALDAPATAAALEALR